MKLVTAQEFEADSGKYLRLAKKEDVIVTRNGKAAARLTSMSQEDFEDFLFETDPRFLEFMRRSQQEHEQRRDSIPIEEVCKQLGLPSPQELRRSHTKRRTHPRNPKAAK